jgi:hypothetical protein
MAADERDALAAMPDEVTALRPLSPVLAIHWFHQNCEAVALALIIMAVADCCAAATFSVTIVVNSL